MTEKEQFEMLLAMSTPEMLAKKKAAADAGTSWLRCEICSIQYPDEMMHCIRPPCCLECKKIAEYYSGGFSGGISDGWKRIIDEESLRPEHPAERLARLRMLKEITR